MTRELSFRYMESLTPEGKQKVVMFFVDGLCIGEAEAKDYLEWMLARSQEIREWVENNRVPNWVKKRKRLKKTRNLELSYVG